MRVTPIRIHYDRGAGGFLRVWVDASLQINVTHTTEGAAINRIEILGLSNPNEYFYDDFFIAISESPPPVGQIIPLLPNGPGSQTEFSTTVGSANHWENVDEVPVDDADYNQHEPSTIATDLYALADPPPGTINAVKGIWRRKRGSGASMSDVQHNAWRESGTTDSELVQIGTNWNNYELIWVAPPSSGGSWTTSKLTGLELGVRHNAPGAQDSFVSWTVPMVDYQYVATALRRSVGITATDLNISSRTVQITGTTATFSGPMPDNVGVGDVLQYQVAAVYYLAFIDGRTSDAVYTVRSASGGTPQTAAAGTAVGVYRAYTSLFNWEAQNENDSLDNSVENFDTSTDLVSNNTSIMVACYGDGEDTTSVAIDGWTTGPDNYIKIYTPISLSEVGTSQRHDGKWSTSAYRISNTMNVDSVILVGERYVRIDGIQVDFQKAPATPQVATTDIRGILVRDGNADAAAEFHISNNIVRQTFGTPAQDTAEGILALDNFTGTVPADNADYVAKVWNNIVYGFLGVARAIPFSGDNYGTIYAFNNTAIGDGGAAGSSSYCFDGSSDNANTFFVKNNIAIDATNPYNQVVTGAGSNNNVSDIGDAPPTGARNCEPTFVNKAGDDYHLAPSDTCAQDWGADLSSDFDLAFAYDIDLGGRQTPWDIGADDVLATTAVELVSFETRALDGAVELTWETGSELNNLGFHLYRSEFEGGRYERITSSAIPGLGSSPEGASYSYKDSGLTNGLTYYYKLEDIETTGKTELHGPVSATPQAGASSSDGDSGDGSSDSGSSGSSPGEDGATSLITYGDPSANTLRVLRRSRRQVVLELLTEGFYAEPQDDGTVRITIPDFAELAEAGSPSVPVRRSWVEVIAGRKVKLVSVTARGVEAFTSLRPSDADMPEIVATREGTVRLARRRSRRSVRRRERAAFQRGGLYPSEPARVVSVGFQGEAKKALVELAPLRWDESRGQLLLARRLVVRLSFRAPDPAEHSTDGVRGRRDRRRRSHDSGPVVARLLTTERGLHAVRYEEVLRSRRGVRARALRLSRQGESVAFHLEPSSRRFKPGSTLYFVSEGASANPYGRDAVYELELGRAGETMTVSSAAPSGQATSFYWKTLVREENRLYQAALLEAPDVWLWDWLFGPMVKSYPFEVSGLALSSEPSHVSVWLQGASDFRANPDHHVRVYVNGSLVDDVSWDGKQAKKIDVDLLPGILQEGENRLELENVGDTEAAYSMVMLDRFELRHPQLPVAEGGKLEGIWNESGVAELTGLAAAHVLDVTPGRDAQPRWLTGSQLSADGVLRFRAEEGRRYHAVSPEAVYHPVVSKPKASRLKNVRNRADYLVIGPQAFLQAAQPLLELRRSQGLAVKTAAIEDIYSDFGFGESTPRAVKDFLSYAYHNWKSPSPRYVLLLGDATYDYKDYLGTGVKNQVPPLMVKTRYLWTSSDPTYAAVNGEDLLPDLAIGRLPAATVEEARAMVAKIVAYETGDVTLEGTTVLVADNADRAGNFQADAEEIASGLLSSREVKKIYLSQLSRATTRSAIVEAFDEGASLMSYVGHGGIAIWASENVFNLGDVDSLEPQAQQPLLLTMNCLNGYYHFPYFNSLSEELVKAEGKGAIAAFSPSGLSLNGPANLYHQALLQELFNGSHERLGDAVLAAQVAYAETGGFPELLSIYHLLGDPALRLK